MAHTKDGKPLKWSHLNTHMKTFKQYLEENYNGKTIVKHGIKISFHNDRIDYHKGGDLIHSHKGDYRVATSGHMNSATSNASKLQSNTNHFKDNPKYRPSIK